MTECGCSAESEFERGFEEVAAKDHEVVAVAVLRLHDLRGGQGSVGHVVSVGRFTEGVVGVCTYRQSDVRFGSAPNALYRVTDIP